jgi:hypothetical protein
MMAAVFYETINQALNANAVVAPGVLTLNTNTVCDKFAGTGVDAGGKTQRGSGSDDGIYYHDSKSMGVSIDTP